MAEQEYDNLDLDLDSLDTNIQRNNKVEERIINLSRREKEAQARADAEATARAEAEAKNATLAKEVEFFSSFTDSQARYPSALEYKDAIKEKVLSGYTVEDATVAVLAREGKLGGATAPIVPKVDSPVGGSAVTQPLAGGEKSLREMSQDELKAELNERLALS